MIVLSIGCGPKGPSVPPHYEGWEVRTLDMNPRWQPDYEMDVRELDSLPAGIFDAVYGSHILEHFYITEIPGILAGISHVLTNDGICEFRAPNALAACRAAASGDLHAVCYAAPAGTVLAFDILWGFVPYIEDEGEQMGHHCGFSKELLAETVRRNGFPQVYVAATEWDLWALGCKTQLSAEMLARLPVEATA